MSRELVTLDAKPIGKGRVSPALRTAIVLMVEEGLTVAEAAQRTNYKRESLAKAMLKPHVRAVRDGVKRAWLANETGKAWLTVGKLAAGAASEDVKLKAAKVFLDAAGELTPKDKEAGARTLINIVMSHPAAGQPIPHQLPGVIEAQPIQRARVIPSNLQPVGRGEPDQ